MTFIHPNLVLQNSRKGDYVRQITLIGNGPEKKLYLKEILPGSKELFGLENRT